MKNKTSGSIIVLSGPSGVGKSTLTKLVRSQLPELRFSVSCTTRAPRAGELQDVDYHFISESEFSERLSRNEFVEHAQVFDRHYGTLKEEVLSMAQSGIDVLLDIDVQGAMQIKEAAKSDALLAQCVTLLFVAPPSLAELEKRLRGRATDSAKQIELRLNKAESELSHWRKYDFVLINDNAEAAAERMIQLISTLRMETRKSQEDRFNG